MINTQIRFKGHRILLESDPNLPKEANLARASRFQYLVDEKILTPRSEELALDIICLPEPKVAYDEVTCRLLIKKELA